MPTATSGGGSTSSTSPSPIAAQPSSPKREGYISTCTQFYDLQSGDGCGTVESKFNFSFGTFYNQNPSIQGDCTGLWAGYSYCVDAPALNPAEPAAPTRPSTLADTQCKHYYTIEVGDGCYSIEQKFGISLEELYHWTTDIKSDCSDLELGYALCVKG